MEQFAISFSRESYWPKGWTHNSCIGKQIPYHWATQGHLYGTVQFSLVPQSCPTLFDPMDCSTPGLPVHCQLPEFTQTHVHWVGDAMQPSHPLSFPSPSVFNPSQHQGLFQWVSTVTGAQRDKDIGARIGALVKKDVYVEGVVMGSGSKARCEFGPPFLPWWPEFIQMLKSSR